MKKHILGFVARLLVIGAIVGVTVGAKSAASTQEGCNKQQAQTALDMLRFTADQIICMTAEYELGHTDPAVVKLGCGLIDTGLKDIEQFLLAQAKGHTLAAAKRAAAAGVKP